MSVFGGHFSALFQCVMTGSWNQPQPGCLKLSVLYIHSFMQVHNTTFQIKKVFNNVFIFNWSSYTHTCKYTQRNKHTHPHGQRNHMAIFSLCHVRTHTHIHTQVRAVSTCISFSEHFWHRVTFLWPFLILYSLRTIRTWRPSWFTCACWSHSPAPATGRPSGWKQVSEWRRELCCCCCSTDWTWVCVVNSVAAAVQQTGHEWV